jgi:allophanate hydrolase subunit 2
MVIERFDVLGHGLFWEKGAPLFGRQDLGHSPGGALDQFSLATGNILLDNEPSTPGLEIVLAPRLRFHEDACFVLTGGRLEALLVDGQGGDPQSVEHARVYRARAGSVLQFGLRRYGFRTYLCYRRSVGRCGSVVGRIRGKFSEVARWPDARGGIRVLPGPEYSCLSDPSSFFTIPWKISVDSNDMALRLLADRPLGGIRDMISAPVNDGTIQLAPSGPLVLLRSRQTVGGYPRVLNVISADLDLLAQYEPGQHLCFRRSSLEEARSAARVKKADLQRLSRRFCQTALRPPGGCRVRGGA